MVIVYGYLKNYELNHYEINIFIITFSTLYHFIIIKKNISFYHIIYISNKYLNIIN